MPAEALGICSRPDGKMHNQVQRLQKKVDAWTGGIQTGQVPKEVAWYCLNSTIMKTIKYPLVATTFLRQDTHQFMKPLLKVTLNSVGVQKQLPATLMYGTLKCGVLVYATHTGHNSSNTAKLSFVRLTDLLQPDSSSMKTWN